MPGYSGCDTQARQSTILERVKEQATPQVVEAVKKEREKWHAQLEKEADAEAAPLRVPFIMKVLRETIDPTAIITVDVGDNSFWFGRNFVRT